MIFSTRFVLILSLFISISSFAKELPLLKVGYLQNSMDNYSPKDLKISMNIWIQSVTEQVGYNAKMFFYKDPKKAAQDFYAGKIDLITGFPLDFVKYFDTSKLGDGFSGGYKDEKQNRFVILGKKDNSVKGVQKLKKAKVGIQKNDTIMHLYVKLYMPTAKIIEYKTRSKIILDLFFSKLDIAIVPLHNYLIAQELNPQIAQEIKIVKQMDYISSSVGFYRQDFDEQKKKDIFAKGLQIFHSPKGKQMMVIYKMETLIKTPVSSLQNAQELYARYRKHQQKGKK